MIKYDKYNDVQAFHSVCRNYSTLISNFDPAQFENWLRYRDAVRSAQRTKPVVTDARWRIIDVLVGGSVNRSSTHCTTDIHIISVLWCNRDVGLRGIVYRRYTFKTCFRYLPTKRFRRVKRQTYTRISLRSIMLEVNRWRFVTDDFSSTTRLHESVTTQSFSAMRARSQSQWKISIVFLFRLCSFLFERNSESRAPRLLYKNARIMY